jgi:hypothetical protein
MHHDPPVETTHIIVDWNININLPGLLAAFLSFKDTIMTTLSDLQDSNKALIAETSALRSKVDQLILNGTTVLDALRVLQAGGGGATDAELRQLISDQTQALADIKAEEANVDSAAGNLTP